MDVQEPTGEGLAESATEILFARDAENPAVCVVDGHGAKVATRSGRLIVSDGIGHHRRERGFNRATHGLARLVLTATSGSISIDALRWMEGAGVGLVVLDARNGDVVASSTRLANDDARLRRAQALAAGTKTGLAIVQYLIQVKLAGQASIAADELSDPDVGESIATLAGMVAESSSLEEVRYLEAAAANLYWSAWRNVAPSFVKKDVARVPGNWQAFEARKSAVNPSSSRNASDPLNALLNYLYRLIEAEGHLATVAVGLDPGLGILHADTKGRPSFVLDLIEVARPVAERHLLRLVRSHTFRWRDFHEDARGVVRVLPPLTHRLAEAMPGFGTTLAPVAEHVAQLLAGASPYDVTVPSVLTKEKHKAAARRRIAEGDERSVAPVGPGMVGRSSPRKQRQRPTASAEPALPRSVCKGCGAALRLQSNGQPRHWCAACLAERRREVGRTLPGASAAQAAEFGDRTGSRPTHTDQARHRRSSANREQRVLEQAWESENAGEAQDQGWFQRTVVPGLAAISLVEIANATGMSTSAASKIRAGRRVPHARHWPSLADLVGLELPEGQR